jgi:5-methylcytosine-specific restriction protein A
MQTLKPRVQVQGNRLTVMPKPSQQAGYRIRGRTLQRIRAVHLNENPLCVICLAKGIVKEATEVDHILALTNGGQDVEDNRQGLCGPCHEAKTVEDLKA